MLRWVLKKNAKIRSDQLPLTETLNPFETEAPDTIGGAHRASEVINNERLAKLNQAIFASAGEETFYSEEADDKLIETLAQLRADMALVERNIFKSEQVLSNISAVTQTNLAAHITKLISRYPRPEYALALIENKSICYHIPTNDLRKLGNALINLSTHNQDKAKEASIEKVVLSFAKDIKFRRMLSCYQIMDWAQQYQPLLNYVTQDLTIIAGTDPKRFDDYVLMNDFNVEMNAFCQLLSNERLLTWSHTSHVVGLFVLKSDNLMDRLGIPKQEPYFGLDLDDSDYLNLAEFYATDAISANQRKCHQYFEQAFAIGLCPEQMKLIIYQFPELLVEYLKINRGVITSDVIREQFQQFVMNDKGLSMVAMESFDLAESLGLFEAKLYLELPLDAEDYRQLADRYAKYESAQAKQISLECTIQSLEALRLEEYHSNNTQQTFSCGDKAVQNIIFYSDSDESTDVDDDTNSANNVQEMESDDFRSALSFGYKNPYHRSYHALPNVPSPPITQELNDSGYESDTEKDKTNPFFKVRVNN